jgi:hypothetical protein
MHPVSLLTSGFLTKCAELKNVGNPVDCSDVQTDQSVSVLK